MILEVNYLYQKLTKPNDFTFSTLCKERCKLSPPCITTKYAYSKADFVNSYNQTVIEVSFQDMEVENHKTYLSYDFQSLIGEVGGTLGLTLGASAFSLTKSFSKIIGKACILKKVSE